MRSVGCSYMLLAVAICVSAETLAAQTRSIWSGEDPDFSTGDVSPDGRYLSDIDWDSGDLAIVDLETGESRGLTGRGYEAGGYAWSSAFSTDGRRLAVAWYLDEADGHELRIVDADGTGSRVLLPAGGDPYFVDPVAWSPSDEHVLVAMLGRDLVWRIAVVSVDDGSVRTLKTLGWLAPGGEQTYPNADWSPDGKYVAYDYRPDLAGRDRDVFLLAVDGSRDVALLAGPAADRLLGWTPDGRHFLFHSDRGGTAGIWRLPVRDGEAAGDPELVLADVGALVPLGFTRSGYAYGAPLEEPRLHSVALDPEGGGVAGSPRPVDDPVIRRSLSGDWSPDGTRLVYVAFEPPPSDVETLVIRSAEGEAIREMPLSPTMHTSTATIDWIDERTLLVFAVEKGSPGVYRLDPTDGSFERVPGRDTDAIGSLKWFEAGPGGRTVYLLGPSEGDGPPALIARDTETGEQRVIANVRTDDRSLAVSPDGAEVAFIARDTDAGVLELVALSTSGDGERRTIHRADRGERIGWPVAWTPDGTRIVLSRRPVGGEPGLWAIAANGQGEPVRLGGGEWCCGFRDLRFHPDGRRLLFSTGSSRGEVRILGID
ncbi:MAG TPA: hypothetical protein VM778_04095 [Gemmatimonadota bacterium]|nr:hypothetical protein [Gemmatimonadota bacterium]